MNPGSSPSEIAKPRILIVEDEPMLAYALEEALTEEGFAIAGVASRTEQALAMIATAGCDGAVIDMNLGGQSAAPIAAELRAREIPFVVVSGYSKAQQLDTFPGECFLQKPYRSGDLISALRIVLARR